MTNESITPVTDLNNSIRRVFVGKYWAIVAFCIALTFFIWYRENIFVLSLKTMLTIAIVAEIAKEYFALVKIGTSFLWFGGGEIWRQASLI